MNNQLLNEDQNDLNNLNDSLKIKEELFINKIINNDITEKSKDKDFNTLNIDFPNDIIIKKNKNKNEKKFKLGLKKPKTATFKNFNNMNLKSIYFPIHKKIIIDNNIINNYIISKQNINKEKQKEKDKGKENKDMNIKEDKPININNENNIIIEEKKDNNNCNINKYITPHKDEEKSEENDNDNSHHTKKRKKLIRRIRREKNSNDKKIQKHQHQAKKEINEEIHMSDFKSQNKDKSLIEGEEDEIKDISIDLEINNSKDNNNNNNENNENNKNNENNIDEIKKNEVFDEFIKKDLENENINKKNNIKENISEDIIENFDYDYEIKNNEYKDNDEMKEKLDKQTFEKNSENEKSEIYQTEEDKNSTIDEEKRKDFFKTFLNSINKDFDFYNPLINKNPGNLYIKEYFIQQKNQNYKDMIKKFNRKTGKFNLFLNKAFSNKFLFKDQLYHNTSNTKESINNKTFDKSKKNLKDNLSNICHKLKEDIFSIKSVSNRYSNNKIKTPSIKKSKNFKKNYNSQNKHDILNTEGNLNIKNIFNFLINENEKFDKRLTPINYRKNKEQKNRIADLINDPYNPYSTIWPNRFLNINYNLGLNYKGIELGVPQLKIEKLKRKNLPPLYQRNKYINNGKFIFHTYSNGFNSNKKKDLINECKSKNKIENNSLEGININKNNLELNYNQRTITDYNDNTNKFIKKHFS